MHFVVASIFAATYLFVRFSAVRDTAQMIAATPKPGEAVQTGSAFIYSEPKTIAYRIAHGQARIAYRIACGPARIAYRIAVSYTHLTLPTNREV